MLNKIKPYTPLQIDPIDPAPNRQPVEVQAWVPLLNTNSFVLELIQQRYDALNNEIQALKAEVQALKLKVK